MGDEDCMCKRCGSSMSWECCDQCGGDGYDGHECGEDTCACADPVDNRDCDRCDGRGGWGLCLASADWCEANPRQGHEETPRHTPEWLSTGAFDGA